MAMRRWFGRPQLRLMNISLCFHLLTPLSLCAFVSYHNSRLSFHEICFNFHQIKSAFILLLSKSRPLITWNKLHKFYVIINSTSLTHPQQTFNRKGIFVCSLCIASEDSKFCHCSCLCARLSECSKYVICTCVLCFPILHNSSFTHQFIIWI